MLILTLVATLAASMVWDQHRSIQVESAERARTQASWVLSGALDWARLILREDARSGGPDHLGEPWAVPLAEARLSTFLATDSDNNTDSGPEAFLSGTITDAQARYNLRNLIVDGKVSPAELKTLRLLCESVGATAAAADLIAKGLLKVWVPTGEPGAATPLAPVSVSQLTWLGLDAATLRRLRTHVDLLPVPTPVNINTASREVLAAVLEGVDLGSADRLTQLRQRQAFKSLEDIKAQVGGNVVLDARRIDVASRFFEVSGRLRLDERVLEERSLVERRGLDVLVVSREQFNSRTDAP